MKRYKVALDTRKDINEFVSIANTFPHDDLRIVDNNNHQVSAQSLVGVLYSMEWDETYLLSLDENPNVFDAFADFVVE